MIECAMYCLRHRLTSSNSNTQLKWETFYTLLNVVTLDLSWSQISLETFQTIEWCRNHKHRQPETILSYCESIVYGWRCLGFYTWKQKLFRTFKHSDIPGSQLLSDRGCYIFCQDAPPIPTAIILDESGATVSYTHLTLPTNREV